ncbi:MAG: VOC family protein [Candidatus Neomarinimicrobiota bacterium]
MKMQDNYDHGLTCSIDVPDIKAAIEWYEKVLGFKTLYFLEDMGWCEMESPVVHVNVGLSEVEKMSLPQGNAVLVWGVKDIEQAKRTLEKHMVKIAGDIRTIPDMVKLLTFYDPFDNCFMLYQDISK